MSLAHDVARCEGKDWDPFGVQPECIDCQRRTDRPDNAPRLSYMDPPTAEPCPYRIATQEPQ